MKRLALVSLVLSVTALAMPAGETPQARTHQVRLNGHTFTLPVGFEIEWAAGPPLVDRPIEADFDEHGRLYVSDSSGSNDKVQEQLRKRPHRILRLEDANGDGRFDRRTVFADRMMFPEGVMWHAGSLYVAAAPSIWKLTDTNGDGVADERLEWFQGKTINGCANDLHGPYAGPDGWIYWCKGAFEQQRYERLPLPPLGNGKEWRKRPPLVTRAAHIFRCRPDGSGIEPVMTGGMDNPVEVVFTAGGERIFTTTFFQHPAGGRRDGLVHAVYGGVYGKVHSVIDNHPRTGTEVMPVLTHLGPAAPCGLVRYESSAFGPDYQGNLFATLFNLHKVTRHVLQPSGATFACRDEDFLVSDNLDFHPTDVLEDADGSLLVIDTGGWYKLCCPTSQLHKPDILGAIYRIRRRGAPATEDPRGLKLPWSKLTSTDLAALLDDARPVVRRRAVQTLGEQGAAAVEALAEVIRSPRRSSAARANAVWAATRIDGAKARAAVRTALADPDKAVRQVAAHSASVRRDREAVPGLLRLLQNPSAHNRRVAAEALGRIGDSSAVPALLEALGHPADRVLEHSLTFALIEIADPDGTAAGLASGSATTRRAALMALDQMEGGGLKPDTVARELTSADPAMKATASWIAVRHPDWGSDLAGFLRDRLAARNPTTMEQEELVHQLARFAQARPVQELLAERLQDGAAQRAVRVMVLRAMARSGLKEAPKEWIAALIRVLTGDHAELVRDAVATSRAVHVPPVQSGALAAALLTIGRNDKVAVDVRLNALAAVPGGLSDVDDKLLGFLRSHLGSDQPVATRSVAADVLSRAKLNSKQLLALAESFKAAGPMEADRLLEAFAQSGDETVGRNLVGALNASPNRAGLRVDTLKRCLAKFGPAVQKQAAELYAALDVDAVKQRARLEELLGALHGGDVRRGQAVFNSPKAACSSCHAIGYLGGRVGPDLTHVGQIRTERDLLEAIVYPSASFVRSYEPVLVTTKAGKSYNGLVRKDAPDEVVLTIGANEEVRVPRGDIEDMQPSKVSLMPAGLDQQLTPRELADLVAFLRACK